MENRQSLLPVFLLVMLSFIWGSSFILMKLGMFDDAGKTVFSAWHVASLRLSIASLALLPVAVYHIRKVDPKKILPIALVGIFGNGIPAFLFTAAEEKLDSSLAGMLNATTTVFAVVFGILFFGMRLKWVNYLGVVIGFAGACGLMLANGSGRFEAEIGHAGMVLVATSCYALSVNLIRTYLTGVHPLAVTSIAFLTLLVPAAITALMTGSLDVLSENPGAPAAFGFISILALAGTAFAVLAFNYLVRMTNAVYASTVTYLMPITSVIWGIIYHEHLHWMHGLFIGVILGGVYLSNRK